jgi:uncharacterized Zn-binding protein involved in type VI secretion
MPPEEEPFNNYTSVGSQVFAAIGGAEKRVARVGDGGSHGGAIVSGSPNVFVNGRPIARVGDIYACPIHGSNPIVRGSSRTFANERRIARIGDSTACGASIVSGSPNTFDGG